jgi:hypothetical protein
VIAEQCGTGILGLLIGVFHREVLVFPHDTTLSWNIEIGPTASRLPSFQVKNQQWLSPCKTWQEKQAKSNTIVSTADSVSIQSSRLSGNQDCVEGHKMKKLSAMTKYVYRMLLSAWNGTVN